MRLSPFKQFRVFDYILGPKLSHYPLYVVGLETIAIRRLVAELA